MESPSSPPDRSRADGDPESSQGPQAPAAAPPGPGGPPPGAPAPLGPQSPLGGQPETLVPQAPAASPQAPGGPQRPVTSSPPPGVPQAPGASPQAPGVPAPVASSPPPDGPAPVAAGSAPAPAAQPGVAPEAPQAGGYAGPVPPGGWSRPVAPALAGARLASWGSRVGASLLDGLILMIPIGLVIALVFAVALGSDAGAIVTAILGSIGYLVVILVYAPLLMMRKGEHNGQTFGKQIVGIRVVRDNGTPFDFAWGFLREFVVKNLLFVGVGQFFLYIPTLLDVLWPLWDDQNRALHDMIVSTHVVKA